MIISIDTYAYINQLRQVHPHEKLLFAASSIVAAFLCSTVVVHLLIIITTSIVLIAGAKVPLKYYFKLLLVPFYFMVASVLTIIITEVRSGDAVVSVCLWGGHWYGITAGSCMMALHLVARAFSVVVAMYFVALTTPMTELIPVLRKIRMPKLLLELMLLVYRSIFVLLNTFTGIKQAQESRLGYTNAKDALRSAAQLLGGLYIVSMQKVEKNYQALVARGYDGTLSSITHEYRYSVKNILFLGGYLAVILIVVVIRGVLPL